MAATASLNKSPHMKEWMAQADPPREANTVKKMNGRSLPIFSNKTTHYFKEWTAARFVLKKTYCLYKTLMLQIDPLSSSCTQIKAMGKCFRAFNPVLFKQKLPQLVLWNK